MPRQDRVDNSDVSQMCPVCRGTGTVPDPVTTAATYVCPYCGGFGRVPPSGGNADALHEYRTAVAIGRRTREQANSASRRDDDR